MQEVIDRPRKHLHASRFELAQHEFNTWRCVPDEGESMETILSPSYWAHVAKRMRPWDRIIVDYQGDEGSYTATLIVQDAGNVWAKVALKEKCDLETVIPGTDTDSPSGYTIKWHGPHAKYAVIRDSDKKKIGDGYPTKGAANQFIAQLLKGLAA